MRNCCTSTLYDKFSYDTREIIRSDKFRKVFPALRLAEDKQALDGWSTNKAVQVSYFGNGVTGTIIGFGASLAAITDDLFKSMDDAMSEKTLDKTHGWYEGTHTSRQEKDCPVIDIGTRWSKKDVIGRQVEAGFYDKVITIPALTDDDKSFCEDVKSTDEYLDIRQRTAPEIWNAEYMQSPIEASGTLFRKDDLKYFKMDDLKLFEGTGENKTQLYEMILGYIDVADEGTDKLAFISAYIFKKKVFVTDIIFSGELIDVTAPLCAGLINRLDHNFVRIETNNQGGGFKRTMETMVQSGKLMGSKNTTNKHTRILIQYGFIKEFFYFRNDYERNSDYDLFMQQMFDYTKAGSSKHDDAPDATAGLAKFCSQYQYLFV